MSKVQTVAKSRKISVSLPSEVVDDLDLIAHLSNTSRSAFLSAVLVKSLPLIKDGVISLCEAVSAGSEGVSDDVVVKRYRSASRDVIDSFLASLDEEIQHDLFKGK